MLTMNPKSAVLRRVFGFSMIDVLIAIVVLSTGLLALALLQGALTRNSADARARSQIAAYAEGLIDQMRASGYSAGALTYTATPTATTNPQQTIVSPSQGSAAQKSAALVAQTAAGVGNLTTTITVNQWAATSIANPAFKKTAGAPLSDAGAYKQVNVTTTWTDSSGQSRSLATDTIISPTLNDNGNNGLIVQTPTITSTTASPTVRQINPAATPGVIPIATGNGNDTAATNPKPQILALNGNNSAVVGTSYNVLTYQAPDNNNETVIQKSVDTKVVMCSCKYGGAVSTDSNLTTVFATPYRPTYWDGSQYVAPTAAGTTSATGVDSSATQDNDCDVCCRDHNDSASDTVKFDPFNTTGNYSHYRYDSTNTLVAVPSSDAADAYMNACRLIRVDGVYAVATDLHNYFFGLLATSSPSTAATAATSSNPDTTDTADFGTGGAVGAYQSFILNYLKTNVSTLEQGSLPSLATAQSSYAASPYNLDVPTSIKITYSSTNPDYRYLHARGLYIDYLEPAAVTAITNAIASCTATDKSSCYLPLLPFTTINVTDIANWSPSPGGCHSNSVSVNNDAIITVKNAAPTFNSSRGVVSALSCASTGDTATVTTTISNSNSGLAATGSGFGSPVDLDDASASNKQSDTQAFSVSSSNSSGSGSVSATLYLTPVPASVNSVLPQLYKGYSGSYPTVSWQLDSTAAPTGSLTSCSSSSSGNGGNKQLNSYTCPSITTSSTPPLAAVITVTVQNYNYAYTAAGSNPCWSGHNTTVQYCANYKVDTANILVNGVAEGSLANIVVTDNGNVGNTTLGTTPEKSTITFPSLNLSSTDTISIGFTAEGVTSPSYTCSGSNSRTATYASCQ
ncbi:type IV pilus modification protein PilV [Rudaea sp.]|uniref:type IV pilus modification protein PilV n=1 Tax=Rudaea sp. TaxID=2136325 RepID=UPI002ED60AB9